MTRPHRRSGQRRERQGSAPSAPASLGLHQLLLWLPQAPVEDEEAEQHLDGGPLLAREEKSKRKARRPLPPRGKLAWRLFPVVYLCAGEGLCRGRSGGSGIEEEGASSGRGHRGRHRRRPPGGQGWGTHLQPSSAESRENPHASVEILFVGCHQQVEETRGEGRCNSEVLGALT